MYTKAHRRHASMLMLTKATNLLPLKAFQGCQARYMRESMLVSYMPFA